MCCSGSYCNRLTTMVFLECGTRLDSNLRPYDSGSPGRAFHIPTALYKILVFAECIASQILWQRFVWMQVF